MSRDPFKVGFEVRGYDCGYGGPLRPLSLFNFIQESAGCHAKALKIGREHLTDMTWMISKIDLRMDGTAAEGDVLEVATWPSGMEKMLVFRDFIVMKRGSDKPLARAVYAYVMVDIRERRLLRPEKILPPDFAFGLPRSVTDQSFGASKAAPVHESFTVHASNRHIDHNGHVNNAHTVDWLFDAVPRPETEGKRLVRARIDFQAEILEGDIVRAKWDRMPRSPDTEGTTFLSGLYRSEETTAKAEMTWSAE